MIGYELKLAWRHILKNRLNWTISVLSLLTGLTVAVSMGVLLIHELNYDSFHEKGNRTGRVLVETDFYGPKTLACTSDLAGPALLADYPEVETMVRLRSVRRPVVSADREIWRQEQVYFADADFFKMFDFTLLSGSMEAVLNRPNTAVVSRSVARRLNRQPVLGSTLMLDGREFEITGIVEDMRADSHLHCEVLLSMASRESQKRRPDWTAFGVMTYVTLREGSDWSAFNNKIRNLSGCDPGGRDYQHYSLQPVREIHTTAGLMWERARIIDRKQLSLWALLGVGILLMAIVNYINLTTARTVSRMRDVSLFRILGAESRHLLTRLMIESALTVLVSLLLAAVPVYLFHHHWARLVNVSLSGMIWTKPVLWQAAVLIWAGTTLLSGWYPAWLLSRQKPSSSSLYQGKSRGRMALRQVLIVLQFGLAAALLVVVTAMGEQNSFLHQQALGFERMQKLVFRLPSRTMDRQDQLTVKSILAAPEGVRGAALSRGVPGMGMDYASGQWQGAAANAESVRVYHMEIDEDFISLYGLKRVAGEMPGPEAGIHPEQGILVNQALVRHMGWPDDQTAVGKSLRTGHFENAVIAGVVQDFHFAGLQESVGALLLAYCPEFTTYLTLELETGSTGAALKAIQQAWESCFPDLPFEPFFLDEHFDAQYQREAQLEQAFKRFSMLGMFIAMLGLWGMASFLTQQRRREVAVRKVLGASVMRVTGLLIRQYFIWVLLANAVAAPLVWWGLHQWLQDYAFHVQISAAPFVLALLLTETAALLTVAYWVGMASLANPAVVIRENQS